MGRSYINHKPGELITENTDQITIKGHYGKWFVVSTETHNGRTLFELEHETHGDSAAHLIVDCHGVIVLEDVWNSFDDYYESLD